MKSAKERKMERKAKHKALSVEKTVKSRQRRLDNKAKRAEIHAIDPDMKIIVIDQVTYNYLGTEITVENGVIRAVSEDFDQKLQDKIKEVETVEVFNAEIEEVEAVEVDDVGKFQKLVNKWRK